MILDPSSPGAIGRAPNIDQVQPPKNRANADSGHADRSPRQ
jgi:hypothetical protein